MTKCKEEDKSQNAPLPQRIQFLEAKGLSGPEIDQAIRLAAAQPLSVYQPAPHHRQWDWRDYFITAVVSGTVAYGAISLFKKYLLPHLKPPTATAYEQDRDALTAQFDAAEALLKEIQAETASVRAAVDEQRERVDKASRDVQAVVVEMRQGETKTRDEMREIRDEIENIREMLPKMIEKNKETQKQSLAELQQELKSLKALLLSRGPSALTSSPSTPIPALTGRPSIPSWQLANSTSALVSESSPPIQSNGKGKEVELSPDESSPCFRQAVESLAQPLPRQSQDDTLPPGPRSQSPDSQRQSSTQLAENALVNLRKSIATQRTASPAQQNTGPNTRPRSASPGPPPTAKSTSDSGLRKTTLEERLRASLAVSESSAGSTPNPSTSVSPTSHTIPVAPHPLSPPSTPVPDSSSLVTATTASAPEIGSAQAEECTNHDGALTPLPQELDDATQLPSPTPPADPQDPASLTVGTTDSTPIDSTTDPDVGVTLSQEVPQVTPQPHGMQQEQASEVTDTLTVDTDPHGEECVKAEPEPTITDRSKDVGVEALQERLKLVEQRFADVSTSFKKLQVERRDMDSVFSELTPLEGSKDVAALREYLINVNMKVELGQDELQRLSGKLTRQEARLEELQDTHRLENASQEDRIEKLRQQLSEAEALLAASQSTASQTEEDNAKRHSDIERLRAEVSKANTIAKEEEEKRVKAISLLKTVRQKLVKAEKERDDALRDLNETRDKSLGEKEKDRAERANLEREVDVVNAEREKAITGLRAQFDKDIVAAKDRAERDVQTAKKQFDVETNALKTSYSAEISSKKSRVSTLENTVANLAGENRSFFEQLELRQAELESSQCHAESLQAQNTELQFQLKELRERITLLNDEVGELQGEHEMRSQVPGVSTEEISQLVSSIEIKYEAKLSELKKTLATAEKERTEAEANWSRKLTEKTKETEELKRMLQSSVQSRERDEDVTVALKAEIEKLQNEARSQHGRLYELQTHIDALKDAESTLHRRLSEAAARADDSEKQLEESKSREAQLRTQNKTLRDELRKVQNSVAVLERQRNPGAGYWSSRSEATDSRTSISSIPDAPSSSSFPLAKNDEEINYEYLRNVILQFLEHKEMRPNLVRVLSTILRFTPQETRRLMSKV
ncbi:hypothetical protein OG21DRAFT_1600190 [Imleria badia]|nr:hypothetical protein OG21DRAFT_1600190 [Imleria badia]